LLDSCLHSFTSKRNNRRSC